jgi:hypothetical protein
VTAGNAERAMIGQYYRTAMEDIVRNTYQQSIYLAKIALIKAGPSYYIESVENMPFRQYVFNGTLAAAMNEITLDSSGAAARRPAPRAKRGRPVRPAAAPGAAVRTVSSGSVVLKLGIGGAEGQRFFSEEIPHGLGLGPVHVNLAMGWDLGDDSPIVCGSPEIFNEQGGEVSGRAGGQGGPRQGHLRDRPAAHRATSAWQARVYWTAVRDAKESVHDQTQRRMFLRPDVCELEVRGTQYFQALFENVSDQRVKWSVKEPQGGEIDENGMYTAPNTAGVYEVVAQSAAHPELTASTYVVVRDPQQV